MAREISLSLREEILNKIREDIIYGRVRPGERLIESRLSEQFDTSRTPIREALRQLESEGLIKFERYRGITISKLTLNEIDELFTIRALLESFAAGLAAERAVKKDVAYLKDLNIKLRGAAEKNDLIRWFQYNTMFHGYLCEHSGNSNLNQLLNMVKQRIHRYRYIVLRIPGHLEEYSEHHEAILRGCLENDGKMAEKYMKRHLEKVKGVLIEFLNTFPDV